MNNFKNLLLPFSNICLCILILFQFVGFDKKIKEFKDANEVLFSEMEKISAQIKKLEGNSSLHVQEDSTKVIAPASSIETNLRKKHLNSPDIRKKEHPEAEDYQESSEYLANTQKNMMKTLTLKQYQKLMTDLNMNESQKDALVSAISGLGSKEAAFGLKFFDVNISAEELLEEQNQINDDFLRDLQGAFDDEQIEKVIAYRESNKLKAALNVYNSYTVGLGLTDKEQESVTKVFKNFLKDNQEPSLGSYTTEYINDFRKKYKGASLGSPEFIKTTINILEEKNKSLLTNLRKQISQDKFEKIKSKVQSSADMLRSTLNS